MLVSYIASSACFCRPAKPGTGILGPVSPVRKKMVLPAQIFMAARNGDIDLVGFYLDAPRLRSLMLRGRTKDAADPIVAHVLRLPNELCWHVLEFWRVESEVTGEVI